MTIPSKQQQTSLSRWSCGLQRSISTQARTKPLRFVNTAAMAIPGTPQFNTKTRITLKGTWSKTANAEHHIMAVVMPWERSYTLRGCNMLFVRRSGSEYRQYVLATAVMLASWPSHSMIDSRFNHNREMGTQAERSISMVRRREIPISSEFLDPNAWLHTGSMPEARPKRIE